MCGTVDSFQSGGTFIGQTALKLASEPEPLNWLTFPVLAHSESENTDHTYKRSIASKTSRNKSVYNGHYNCKLLVVMVSCIYNYRLPNSEAMWVDGCTLLSLQSPLSHWIVVKLSTTFPIHTKRQFLMIVLITLLCRMNVLWRIAAWASSGTTIMYENITSIFRSS